MVAFAIKNKVEFHGFFTEPQLVLQSPPLQRGAAEPLCPVDLCRHLCEASVCARDFSAQDKETIA